MAQSIWISGAAGAWGDSSVSTAQLLADGRSDYIIYEGLAEITMAILTRARGRDPQQGYARDLIEAIATNLVAFRNAGMKVVTNAGGVNPHSAADLIKRSAAEAGIEVSIGIVTGDDLMENDRISVPEKAISMNAYLGARPIAAAFDAGAEVVITGRVVDSALVLGPLIHEFGWTAEELDLLSAGSLAGHLLECGPQATGGLFTDWEETESWANPGYPVAEIFPDGTFVLSPARGSDGIVSVRTTAEQLLYEIGDPAAYLLPDVVCDWTEVQLEEAESGVRVSGAIGKPPPPTLKGCAQIPDGWRAISLLFVGGRDAVDKAERVGRDLIARGESMLASAGLPSFRATDVEVLGAETTYGSHSRAGDAREIVLKVAVHHDSRDAVARFVREVPSMALGGPPGVAGGGMGLPRPSPLIQLECGPVDRGLVAASVEVEGELVEFQDVAPDLCRSPEGSTPDNGEASLPAGATVELPLVAVAHVRSGDKGAHSNIGVRARHPAFLPVIVDQVTTGRVADWMAHLGAEKVDRFHLPGIDAVNLLLYEGLGSGGAASLRFDPQGKALGQQLLDMPVSVPVELLDHPEVKPIPEVITARSR